MRTDSFRDYVLEQLAGLDGLRCRKMFGGHGWYWGGQFFVQHLLPQTAGYAITSDLASIVPVQSNGKWFYQ